MAAGIDRGRVCGAVVIDIQPAAGIDRGVVRRPAAGDRHRADVERVISYKRVFQQESGPGRSSLNIGIGRNC